MILCDGMHLVSTDGIDDLHRFAAKIGLKRRSFQRHARHPHYDILFRQRAERAYRLGAQRVTSRELVRRLKRKEQ